MSLIRILLLAAHRHRVAHGVQYSAHGLEGRVSVLAQAPVEGRSRQPRQLGERGHAVQSGEVSSGGLYEHGVFRLELVFYVCDGGRFLYLLGLHVGECNLWATVLSKYPMLLVKVGNGRHALGNIVFVL